MNRTQRTQILDRLEEMYPEAKAAGARVAGTGRSDAPNQVNNVNVFPGVFRGAIDIRAREINEKMKVAATYAIANLIDDKDLREDYVVADAFDKRVAPAVAAAVAKAAIETGVALVIKSQNTVLRLQVTLDAFGKNVRIGAGSRKQPFSRCLVVREGHIIDVLAYEGKIDAFYVPDRIRFRLRFRFRFGLLLLGIVGTGFIDGCRSAGEASKGEQNRQGEFKTHFLRSFRRSIKRKMLLTVRPLTMCQTPHQAVITSIPP